MNIDAHPIHRKIYELCLEIEALPASEQATKVVVLATALRDEAEQLRNQLTTSEQLISELTSALKEANELCRSAYQISDRSGEATNWDAFWKQLLTSLPKQQEALTHATACLKKRKE